MSTSTIRRVRERLDRGGRDPEVQLQELILEINEQIVECMQTDGVRRSELAERLGSSRAFVTKLLDGHENLTLRTLARVANALEMKVDLRLRKRAATSSPQPASRPRRSTAASHEAGTRAVAARPKGERERARAKRDRPASRGAQRASVRAS